MIARLACFWLGHDTYDMCRGDSCWHCTRCGATWHDPTLEAHMDESTDKPSYAQGGYIGPQPPGSDNVRLVLAPNHVMMSYASYQALDPEMREKMFKGKLVELVYSAAEVKALGTEYLEKLQADAEQ